MVNLALNNGQVVSTSLANLQAMAQPHQLLNSNPQQQPNIRPNMLNPTLSNALLNPGLPSFLSNGSTSAQELLQAFQQPQANHNLLQTVQQNNMNQQMQGRRSSSPRPDRLYKERENFERYVSSSRERSERENSGSAAMNSINRWVITYGNSEFLLICFRFNFYFHMLQRRDVTKVSNKHVDSNDPKGLFSLVPL